MHLSQCKPQSRYVFMIALPTTGVAMGYFGGAGLPFFFTKFTPASGKCFPSDSPPLATFENVGRYCSLCAWCLCVALKVSLAKPRTESSQDSRMAFTSKLDKFLSKCVRSKTRRGPQFVRPRAHIERNNSLCLTFVRTLADTLSHFTLAPEHSIDLLWGQNIPRG